MRDVYMAALNPIVRAPGAPTTPPELFEQDPPAYEGGVIVLKLFHKYLSGDRLRHSNNYSFCFVLVTLLCVCFGVICNSPPPPSDQTL